MLDRLQETKEFLYLPIFTVHNYHVTEVGRSGSAVFKTNVLTLLFLDRTVCS